MDGFSVLESIQEDLNLNEIPIIVYSGRDVTREDLDHFDNRIRSVVEKAGFDRKQFVSLIMDALN
jgi:CheY-like chemotaxis protein